MNELVIFDIDNTLVKGQSQNILLDYLYRKGLIGKIYFLKIYIWFILYKTGIVENPKKVLEYAIKFIAGRRVEEIKRIIDEFVDMELKNYFFDGAIKKINEHKKTGAKIILVSNAIDILVQEIANYLGVNEYIASKLEIKDNKYTGRLEGSLAYGDNKLEKVKSFLASKNDLSLNNAWVYTNHHSDIILLSAVKYPVAVNPDRKLLAYAKEKEWPIIHFDLKK